MRKKSFPHINHAVWTFFQNFFIKLKKNEVNKIRALHKFYVLELGPNSLINNLQS